MLISKFDLYRTEWLDLVFADRNKDYGAYHLRQHYAATMVKAMGITFFGVAVLCGATIVFKTEKPLFHITPVDVKPPVLPQLVDPVKPAEPKLIHHQQFKTLPIATSQNIPPVVVADNRAKKPVINDQISNAIGQSTLKGAEGIDVDIPNSPGESGTSGPGPTIDESVHLPGGLDVMPEPNGGMNAWAKFLNKNLRFPVAAQEEGLSGKVWLSFIIEKDGHLSNIVVNQGAGHGFDEEALRVLKLAKAWKPGMQNGQPVRVRYTIPINFQLAE